MPTRPARAQGHEASLELVLVRVAVFRMTERHRPTRLGRIDAYLEVCLINDRGGTNLVAVIRA
jgi:hypothetical protein